MLDQKDLPIGLDDSTHFLERGDRIHKRTSGQTRYHRIKTSVSKFQMFCIRFTKANFPAKLAAQIFHLYSDFRFLQDLHDLTFRKLRLLHGKRSWLYFATSCLLFPGTILREAYPIKLILRRSASSTQLPLTNHQPPTSQSTPSGTSHPIPA